MFINKVSTYLLIYSLLSSSKPEGTMQERKSLDFPPKVMYENRYCNKDDFSILVCGGKNKTDQNVKSIFKIYGH